MEPEVERRPVASRSRALEHHAGDGQPVVLTDIDIPFERMVTFMVRWSIAAIPAALILLGVAFLVGWAGAWFLLAAGLYP